MQIPRELLLRMKSPGYPDLNDGDGGSREMESTVEVRWGGIRATGGREWLPRKLD